MLANSQQHAAGSVAKKVDTGSGEDSEAESSSKLRMNTHDEGGASAGDLMEGVAERSPKSVAAVMLV